MHPSPSLAWMTALAGKFIVFDGPDGSGKTTQLREVAMCAKSAGIRVTTVREPGGTTISERIRDILLDNAHTEMDVRCELMLYMASRAQLIAETIRPALQRNELVLADRFVSSTLAYQGTAGGIDADEIEQVAQVACGSLYPANLTIVFDVDEQTAATRLNPLLDRMEQKGAAFHRRVRAGYLDQAAQHQDRYVIIDATHDELHVRKDTLSALHNHFVTANTTPNASPKGASA